MKTITQLNGVDFLRKCNEIRHGVESVLKTTGIMEIRKRMPVIEETDTLDERKRKMEEQSKKNLSDMIDVLLDKHPEETVKLFNMMIVLEDGDTEPTGFELLMIGMDIISDKRVMDFLLSLMRLGQTDIQD